jgi:hypothetical protein
MVGRRRTRSQRTVVKAAAPTITPAGTFTPQQVLGLMQAARSGQVTGALVPLPRVEPQVAFGPGVPLIPGAIDPVQPSGRPLPRRNEYPVTANLPGVTDRLVPWSVLRDAAERIPLFRKCIEIRKKEVATVEWTVAVTKDAVNAAREVDGGSKVEVEKALRERLAPEISRCTEFWSEPDRDQGYAFSRWVTAVLEDHLVLDAIALFPRRTRGAVAGLGKDLYALECIDGSTVKPLRDHRGGRPLPPNPAFQQILHGFPRGEFVADVDGDGNVINGYTADRLIYLRSNVRSFTPYGLSAVEQALMDGDLYLKRMQWMGSEYTDGVMPTGWLKQDGSMLGWTPQQVMDFERQINDVYGGQSAMRHRLRVLPPGIEPVESTDVAERYRPEYDLHLIKLVAGHFDVTIAELGFTEQGGLGSTGWHEGQADIQNRRATRPDMQWLQETLTDISRRHIGMPRELELKFLGFDSEDEAEADTVTQNRVCTARMTINEARDQTGQPRLDIPEADMPLLISGNNVTVLEGAADRAAAGAELAQRAIVGKQPAEDDDGESPAPLGATSDTEDADSPPKPAAAEDAEAEKSVKAEIGAYRRWLRKGHTSRPFVAAHLTKADIATYGLDPATITPAAGRDADPKAWPGWSRDRQTANHWAPILAQALTGALPDSLTADYRQTHPDASETEPAEQWLDDRRGKVTATLAAVLIPLMLDGAVIGALSTRALAASGTAAGAIASVDWLGWRPGDTDRARQILAATGVDTAIVEAESRRAAQQLTAGRLTAAAAAIAAGTSITAALNASPWAAMVALTEVGRAAEIAAAVIQPATGMRHQRWYLDPRVDNCPICIENAESGPLPVGVAWPSGHIRPPVHPWCRCHLGGAS